MMGLISDLLPTWWARSELFHFADFEEKLLHYHTCYITGELGSGKTLLAFALARHALRNRYVGGVWTNIKHKFPPSQDIENCFVIFDEAHLAIDNRFSSNTFSMYGAFARKSNTIYAFPSVFGVDKRLRNLEVLRVADIQILPVRIWVYKWFCVTGETGHFGLSYPESLFGKYDTKEVPTSDGGILEAFVAKYPEAVEYLLESRYEDPLKKILGWSSKRASSSRSGNGNSASGGVGPGAVNPVSASVGGKFIDQQTEVNFVNGLALRVEQLERDYEELNVKVSRVIGEGSGKASGYSFRD